VEDNPNEFALFLIHRYISLNARLPLLISILASNKALNISLYLAIFQSSSSNGANIYGEI
jgi:hypothetical protein